MSDSQAQLDGRARSRRWVLESRARCRLPPAPVSMRGERRSLMRVAVSRSNFAGIPSSLLGGERVHDLLDGEIQTDHELRLPFRPEVGFELAGSGRRADAQRARTPLAVEDDAGEDLNLVVAVAASDERAVQRLARDRQAEHEVRRRVDLQPLRVNL